MKKFLMSLLLVAAVLPALAQYDKDAFLYRGRAALQDGKYAQAIENFNILARLDTTDYWNFFFRGIAKYNLGDIRGAQKDFDASIRINPVFTNGYHYRAITKSQTGQYEDALKDLQKAIELRPGFLGLYYSRGVTYFLAQRFENAVQDFNFYIRKEPKDPSAYLNRGAANLFLKDTVRALADYNQAIKLDRYEPEGYIRRGRLYALKGDMESAIADMDRAIELDSTNTFAFFNRALMNYEIRDYNAAMRDLNQVLKEEPGNALSLYNRSLIYAQVGDYRSALDDMDRVININPKNVLAYFNRASFFIQMERWEDALADYNKAISLYPDFAKAYLNRSFVETQLGLTKASKNDYQIAQKKVKEYRDKSNGSEFADTSKRFNSLLSFDADFAKKDFNDELLQHRDIDIRLRPLFKIDNDILSQERNLALSTRYENVLLDRFLDELNKKGDGQSESEKEFLQGIECVKMKQFNLALGHFNKAIDSAPDQNSKNRYQALYKAFYLMNRAVLKAEMIDFIASMDQNVQRLSMDDSGTTRARVSNHTTKVYDYSDAIADMQAAIKLVPDIAYLHYDMGNLRCLASELIPAIESYNSAISLHPSMGEAYFNRGLVLIYLKDKEKGCIDLSRAGELGIKDAYSVIGKYCKDNGD